MKYLSSLLIIALCFVGGTSYSQTNIPGSDRTIAILDVSERNSEETKNVYSLEHICRTIGIPYYVTKDVSVATGFPILIVCSDIDGTFTSSETTLLTKYVDDGGILIAPYVSDDDYFSLFGISRCTSTKKHHTLTWTDFTETALRWIDDPLEKTMSLGDEDYDEVMYTCSYQLTTATPLAKYTEDATVGIARNAYGKGFAYGIGFSFQALIFVFQTNSDMESERTYSSGFEPTSDVLVLFLKGIYAKYIKYATWKHTFPYNNSPIFVLTHDIDCEAAMVYINSFADWEKANNIHATYFVTTHYFGDSQDGDYYSDWIHQIDSVREKGFEIGSHSVGHFPDFTKLPFGQLGNTKQNYSPRHNDKKTTGGSLLGECEVSKFLLETDAHTTLTSFRPGYLALPNKIGLALDTLGYKQSSINSANDVLSNFPYYLSKEKEKSSTISKVLEIPCSWFTDPKPEEKKDSLINSLNEISKKVYDNYAPLIVLLHPTNIYKLSVQKDLIKSLSTKTEFLNINEFENYWTNREAFNYTQTIKNDSLVITIPDSSYPFDNRLSLIINNGQELKSLVVQKQDRQAISFLRSNFEKNDLIIYFKEKEVLTQINNNKIPEIQLSMSAYPNPFTSQITIDFILSEESHANLEIYDIYGRLISTLLDQRLTSGFHQVIYAPKNSKNGIYFCKLKTDKEFIVRKIIRIN